MKIIRINKGKAVSLPIRFTAVVLVVVLTIKLMDWLPEPWSILTAMLICTILPALWFATKVIIINADKKTIFDGVWTMGRKLGKPVKYQAIEKIFINKVKTKQTMYSLSNQQNIIANHEYRAYLKLDNGDKYYLISHPLEERVEEKVTKIRKKLAIN
ncbi:hypothetical protein [Ekhidna sp. To15]|uniref:hypothetical protein n=1 Tax=Ekhidna sp. To15 TaxID=3395267 RepID=UPI003F521967